MSGTETLARKNLTYDLRESAAPIVVSLPLFLLGIPTRRRRTAAARPVSGQPASAQTGAQTARQDA
jgi:hypothetical protein